MGSRRGFVKKWHPGISKNMICWPQLFREPKKRNVGVQGSKNTAKIDTFVHDVFEVAHKSGKVDKTM